MTAPTITYGQSFLCDCQVYSATSILGIDTTKISYGTALTCDWDEAEDGNTITTTGDGDIYDINVTGSIGNKVAYIEWPDSDDAGGEELNIPQSTYGYMTVRYMTSSTSIKAKVAIDYHAAGVVVVMAEDDNTTWNTVTFALPSAQAADTIDHIRLYANGATGHVYYDFAMIHAGKFTWPFSPVDVDFTIPNDFARLRPWGRVGSIKQYAGAPDAPLILSGTVNMDTSWHGSSGFDAERFYQIMHEVDSDPWQWVTTDIKSGKMTPITLQIRASGTDDAAVLRYAYFLEEYHTIGGQNKTAVDRFFDE